MIKKARRRRTEMKERCLCCAKKITKKDNNKERILGKLVCRKCRALVKRLRAWFKRAEGE